MISLNIHHGFRSCSLTSAGVRQCIDFEPLDVRHTLAETSGKAQERVIFPLTQYCPDTRLDYPLPIK